MMAIVPENREETEAAVPAPGAPQGLPIVGGVMGTLRRFVARHVGILLALLIPGAIVLSDFSGP